MKAKIENISDLFPGDIIGVMLPDGVVYEVNFRGWCGDLAIVYSRKTDQLGVRKDQIILLT